MLKKFFQHITGNYERMIKEIKMNNRNILKDILSFYNKLNFDFDVYIVADLQTRTRKANSNQIIHADESEFFSRSEFAEITSAIFYSFGFVKTFYSELEFIKYVLENNIDYKECIVYNFARDGRANGKKSLIPSFCDLLNIKYTGSDAFVISLLRNKNVYTELLEKNGIAVPKSKVFSHPNDFSQLINTFSNQLVIAKNKCESASIGLNTQNIFLFDQNSRKKLYSLLHNMKTDTLLIQEYIDGIECEVLVLQYKGSYYALDPVKIVFKTEHNFIDTDTSNKYNYSFDILESTLNTTIQKMATKAASILEVKDYARFDFRIKGNIPYLIDIAGTPYTIYHSSIAHLFTNHYHLPYESIYKVIVACMLSNYESIQK